MKTIYPAQLQGKKLFDYLIANKSAIINRKKSGIKTTDATQNIPDLFLVTDGAVQKTIIGSIPEDATKLRAKFIGNTANWFDSQQDVLLDDCWKKTIKEGQGRLHLKDHTYKMDAEVGDVVNIYSQTMSLSELGINKQGTTQVLIYESDVQKSYDNRIFNKYKAGKANQHSIGLQYVNLQLAVNDEDYKEEFATWNQYIGKVINKEDAEKAGYMWIVSEIKLREVSVVLMGANEMTPTLEVGKDIFLEDDQENEVTTQKQPEENSTVKEPDADKFDWRKYIENTKFINI